MGMGWAFYLTWNMPGPFVKMLGLAVFPGATQTIAGPPWHITSSARQHSGRASSWGQRGAGISRRGWLL